MNKPTRHPVDELGDTRLCPHTGEVFNECWSTDEEIYSLCDSCAPDHESTAEMLLTLKEACADERARYRKALKWYADTNQYSYSQEDYGFAPVALDEGQRARDALSGEDK